VLILVFRNQTSQYFKPFLHFWVFVQKKEMLLEFSQGVRIQILQQVRVDTFVCVEIINWNFIIRLLHQVLFQIVKPEIRIVEIMFIISVNFCPLIYPRIFKLEFLLIQ
jgi:hypothetical protein